MTQQELAEDPSFEMTRSGKNSKGRRNTKEKTKTKKKAAGFLITEPWTH